MKEVTLHHSMNSPEHAPIYPQPPLMRSMPEADAHTLESLRARVSELENSLEHRERQIDAMRRAGDTLFTSRNVDELVRCTLEIAIDVLDADAGSLLLFNEKDDTLVFRYVVGSASSTLTGFAIPSRQGIAGRV